MAAHGGCGNGSGGGGGDGFGGWRTGRPHPLFLFRRCSGGFPTALAAAGGVCSTGGGGANRGEGTSFYILIARRSATSPLTAPSTHSHRTATECAPLSFIRAEWVRVRRTALETGGRAPKAQGAQRGYVHTPTFLVSTRGGRKDRDTLPVGLVRSHLTYLAGAGEARASVHLSEHSGTPAIFARPRPEPSLCS